MSDEDEFLQKARTGFEDLCRGLNMDEEASSEAWRSYENISRNFTLEVKHQFTIQCRCLDVVLPSDTDRVYRNVTASQSSPAC